MLAIVKDEGTAASQTKELLKTKETRDVGPDRFFPPRSAREKQEMEKWSFQRSRELMTQIALRGMAANEIGRARIP